MSDARYDVYQHYGTAAERALFTPDPPALSGIQPIYVWYETDTDKTWIYHTSWTQVSGGGLYPSTTLTYLTEDDETGDLPNSRQVLEGDAIEFDDTTPGERTIGVADDGITNAKLAEVATSTIKGRVTAGTGNPEDLTGTEATTILDDVVGDSGSGGTKGLVPAPGAGDAAAGKYLKADGVWTVPPTGTGDVTGPGSSTDNALARFDGTTGTVIQDGVVILDDTGNITGPVSIAVNGSLVANTALTVEGQVNIVPDNHSAAGATETIDFSVSNEHTVILDENVTLTLSNPVDGGRYVIIFIQDGSGGNTVSWPASVRWPSGIDPVITSDADKADLVTLYYIASLGIYLGSFNQNYTTT